MNRGRLSLLLSLLGLGACGENLTAPGEGTCPLFCPPEQVRLVDSTLLDAVIGDSAYGGYVLAAEAGGLQLVQDLGGAIPTSRAVFKFHPFPERLVVRPGDTTTGAVLGLDSFGVEISVQARSAGRAGLELVLYRLPISVDTGVTFGALDPFFADTTEIGVVPIPDTLTSGLVRTALDLSAFPAFDADGRRAALGVGLRAPDGGFVTVGTIDAGGDAVFTRYVQFDSAGVTVPRSSGIRPEFDTMVAPEPPALPAGLLRVGGVPAARSLLRFQLPARVVDSSTVVRATLLLVPGVPVRGAPDDTLRILAQGVSVDVGAKSPLLSVPQDSVLRRLAVLPVGFADTVRLDVTDLMVDWTRNARRPRALIIRAVPEGSRFAELAFGSSSSAVGSPRLRVTFVPPVTLGER